MRSTNSSSPTILKNSFVVVLTIAIGGCASLTQSPNGTFRMDDPPVLSPQNQTLRYPPAEQNVSPWDESSSPIAPYPGPSLGSPEPGSPEIVEPPSGPGFQPPQSHQQTGPSLWPPQQKKPAKLELQVKVPRQQQLGSETTFVLTVKNVGDEPAFDVIVECEFDEALTFPGRKESRVKRSLGQLPAHDSAEVRLTLVSQSVGTHASRFTVTTRGEEAVWKSVFVKYVERKLDVEILGPSNRSVGTRAEFTVKVVNNGTQLLENMQTVITYDTAMDPREATEGVARTPGRMHWELGRLAPGEGLQLQVEFECTAAAERACVVVRVSTNQIPEERVEACLKITPVREALDVQVRDDADLLRVGEETEYVIVVRNRGFRPARGIQVSALVPSNLQIISSTVPSRTRAARLYWEAQKHRVNFSPIDYLPRDGMLTYRIRARATRSGDGKLQARVTHSGRRKPLKFDEPTTVNP